jgi:hypothetical protein
MDKVRKEAAGSQLEIGTAENAPVAGQTAHGMERWMTSKEHLSAMFVRTFAETLVKGSYKIAHKLMKLYMPETMQFKAEGQFQQTTPGQWQYGDKPRIDVDTTEAEKQKEYQALDLLIQQQMGMIEKGVGLAQAPNVHNALVKQAQVAGLTNVSDYWIDPMSPQGKQIAQQQAQQAQASKQEQIAQQDKLYNTQMMISKMQEQSDQMKAQLDFMIKENEQLRKWVELELEQKYNVPGQGLKQING